MGDAYAVAVADAIVRLVVEAAGEVAAAEAAVVAAGSSQVGVCRAGWIQCYDGCHWADAGLLC